MGCVLCNITNMDKSPFKCETEEDREEFLNELAYDIAARHPEVVKKINDYVAKLSGQQPDTVERRLL